MINQVAVVTWAKSGNSSGERREKALKWVIDSEAGPFLFPTIQCRHVANRDANTIYCQIKYHRHGLISSIPTLIP